MLVRIKSVNLHLSLHIVILVNNQFRSLSENSFLRKITGFGPG